MSEDLAQTRMTAEERLQTLEETVNVVRSTIDSLLERLPPPPSSLPSTGSATGTTTMEPTSHELNQQQQQGGRSSSSHSSHSTTNNNTNTNNNKKRNQIQNPHLTLSKQDPLQRLHDHLNTR
jgi:hypothetical protein